MLPDTDSKRIGHPLFMRVTSAVVQDSRSDQDAVSRRRSSQSFFRRSQHGQQSSMYRRESSSDPVCPACRKNMTNVRKSSISLPISVCRITGWKHIALLLFLPDFKIVRKHAKPVNPPRRTHTVCVFVPPFYFICSSVKSLNWISVNSVFGRNPSFARAERYSKAGCSSADGVRNTNSTRFHSFEMGMLPFA